MAAALPPGEEREGEQEQRHFRFPKTPHAGLGANAPEEDRQACASDVVDDDATVPLADVIRGACDAARGGHGRGGGDNTVGLLRVVVQEKVDGANVGVHFGPGGEWDLVVQKRSGEIEGRQSHAQFEKFKGWCWEHAELLWPELGNRYVLFGEWLYQTHGVAYDQLSHLFLAFDVLDKEEGQFWSAPRVAALVRRLNRSHEGAAAETEDEDAVAQRHAVEDELPPLPAGPVGLVPQVAAFALDDPQNAARRLSPAALDQLVGPSKFSSSERAEGVYIRIEDATIVRDRVKFRRATFESGRAGFGWDQSKTNKLAAMDS
jgi:RNA ligase